MANRFTTFPESWWAYMPKPFKLLSDDLKALEAIVAAGGSGTPAGTTFAGIADGAAWPAPWAAGKVPATGSVTVQSEQGRLATGSAVGNYSSADGTSAGYTTQAADFTATFTFRRVTSVHVRFVARCNAQTLDPQDGVLVGLHGSPRADAGSELQLLLDRHHAEDVEQKRGLQGESRDDRSNRASKIVACHRRRTGRLGRQRNHDPHSGRAPRVLGRM